MCLPQQTSWTTEAASEGGVREMTDAPMQGIVFNNLTTDAVTDAVPMQPWVTDALVHRLHRSRIGRCIGW